MVGTGGATHGEAVNDLERARRGNYKGVQRLRCALIGPPDRPWSHVLTELSAFADYLDQDTLAGKNGLKPSFS